MLRRARNRAGGPISVRFSSGGPDFRSSTRLARSLRSLAWPDGQVRISFGEKRGLAVVGKGVGGDFRGQFLEVEPFPGYHHARSAKMQRSRLKPGHALHG